MKIKMVFKGKTAKSLITVEWMVYECVFHLWLTARECVCTNSTIDTMSHIMNNWLEVVNH